jgi:protein TonB
VRYGSCIINKNYIKQYFILFKCYLEELNSSKMLNTKLNLYNAEWLDLVFDKRNKIYGAYDLRQHYAGNMIRAMAVTFAVIAAGGLYLKLNAAKVELIEPTRSIVVDIQPPPVAPIKKIEPQKAEQAQAQPASAMHKFLMPKPTSSPVTEEPPKNIDLTGQTGPIDRKGEPGAPVDVIEDVPVGPPAAAPSSNDVFNTGALEIQPEPYGGMGAFSKFLSKNLRFPAAASDAGASGRVIVSFVIEKDGSLSNIVVERGAGYGMDQEAVRVLKLAKAWKPGIQNGQPVRVRYMVPINFQLPE